jgi:hypothetical protein
MAGPGNNGEFHRADPAYRRQMQIWLVLTVLVGAAVVVGLQWWLGRLGSSARMGDLFVYETWLHRLLGGLCLLLGAASAGFAWWIHRVAEASRVERRWPPSSMRTSADVRIRYLTSADSLVGQLRATAIALFAMAVLLCGWALWLFWSS